MIFNKTTVHEKRDHDINSNKFVTLGRTETIKNDINPQFSKYIKLEYCFEESKVLRFDCWNYDSTNSSNHHIIGSCTVKVSQILRRKGSWRRVCLLDTTGNCMKNKETNRDQTLTVQIVKPKKSNRDVTLQFACTLLPKMDMFGQCDAYFKIYRVNKNGSWGVDGKYNKKGIEHRHGRTHSDSWMLIWDKVNNENLSINKENKQNNYNHDQIGRDEEKSENKKWIAWNSLCFIVLCCVYVV